MIDPFITEATVALALREILKGLPYSNKKAPQFVEPFVSLLYHYQGSKWALR